MSKLISRNQWFQVSGLGAIAAGILRSIGAVLPSSSSNITNWLYPLTDVCLAIGLVGLYGFQQRQVGQLGQLTFWLALSGLFVIRLGPILSRETYTAGALIFAIGLIGFAIASELAHRLPLWVTRSWIYATLVGFLGYFVPNLQVLFVIAGIWFGVAFMGAGMRLLQVSDRSRSHS